MEEVVEEEEEIIVWKGILQVEEDVEEEEVEVLEVVVEEEEEIIVWKGTLQVEGDVIEEVEKVEEEEVEEVEEEEIIEMNRDVITLILVRLPVKSLLRYKSVSKFWYSLITSSRFVKMHLIHTHNQNDNYPIILLRTSDHKSLHALTYTGNASSPHNDHTRKIAYPLFNSPDSYIHILGSCNGLLLISARFLYLVNPSTQEYRRLPCDNYGYDIMRGVTAATSSDYMITYGFGFNRTMDVYRVIRLRAINTIDKRFVSSVEVCSKECWRTIQRPLPYSWPSQKLSPGLHVNGAVHWLINISSQKQTPCYKIFSFDIGDEEYRDVPKPPGIDDETYTPVLCVLKPKGCLSILTYNTCIIELYLYSMDVWMMMDYAVKESWTKLTRICTQIFSYSLREIWFCKNGSVQMDTPPGNVYLFEPNSNKAMPFGRCIPNSHSVGTYRESMVSNFHSVGTYVESLVSLESRTYIGRRSEGERVGNPAVSLWKPVKSSDLGLIDPKTVKERSGRGRYWRSAQHRKRDLPKMSRRCQAKHFMY